MAENRGLILLVDDDEAVLISAQQWLTLAGFEVIACASAALALRHLGKEFPGILVTDVRMPGMGGLDLMRHALEADAGLPVVLMTGHGDVAMAVQAIRDGAYDFIEKPYPPEILIDIVRRALEKRALVRENSILRTELRLKTGIDALLLGQSAAMIELRQTVTDLADTSANVVIHGETGTGKERVAHCLHAGGRRSQNPMVAINCAAIPESIFESELFGHE
ncbi:MAG: sigma-54-dependent Fis family transcriptional regulator, partial [Deltaproteobacteria bacterium]